MENKNASLFSEFPGVSTQEWEAVINADLKGADYEKKLIWQTLEGIKVKPYYRAEDLKDLSYLKANPGEAPYIRGNKTNNNSWDIRQDIEEENIIDANKKAIDAVNKGATSIGLRVKMLKTAQDMAILLKGIDITKVKINFISSHSFPQTLDFFLEFIKNNKIDSTKVFGSFNFDPLSYLLLHGEFYSSFENNIDEAQQLITNCEKSLPNFKVITVNGNLFHNSGASSVQELAFTLASANEYLYQLINKGMAVDKIAPEFVFSFAIGSNYFMEIAKIRAARLLWAKIVEQYNATTKEAMQVFIHNTTSMWNKTVYDPYVNMLRTTTEAMSAAIGGADSIAVLPFDEPYKDADDFSGRIARNQQIILKEESYLDKIVDPSAGSYYIENLCNSIAAFAWDLFKKVEAFGGFAEAVKKEFIQNEIEKTAQIRNIEIANRKTVILGTNQYPNSTEEMLDKIQDDIDTTEEKFSTYKKLNIYRGAEAFEDLRLATEIYINEGNKKPAVFLFTIGSLSMRKARASFAANFFGCAGYEIIDNNGFKTAEEGVKVALASKAEIVVICSSDEDYIALVPEITASLKKQNPEINVTVAGYPAAQIEMFKNAGVDEFIHVKSNVITILNAYQEYLGVI
ncbi:MAG: methylmalonyl-CoA mutase family protein [Bacteroidetes bacterium]|nr:methylmalonyl-CoA mutase family protein [Bacteroidota bacterium]